MIKYEYDFYGNQTSYTDGEGNEETCVYDEMTGLLLSKTLANGSTVSYGYDQKGNVVSETATKSGSPTQTKSFVYNIGGQLISATDTNGITTTYVYDDYGSVSTEIYTQNGITVIKTYTYETGTDELKTVSIKTNGTTRIGETYPCAPFNERSLPCAFGIKIGLYFQKEASRKACFFQ